MKNDNPADDAGARAAPAILRNMALRGAVYIDEIDLVIITNADIIRTLMADVKAVIPAVAAS